MMKNINTKTMDAAIEKKEIITVKVEKIEVRDKIQVMLVSVAERTHPLFGLEGTISREDADLNFKSGTVNHLISMSVPATLESYDKESGVGTFSRKEAQRLIREKNIDIVTDGEEHEGTILNFAQSGAFVSVKGIVGMLKTTNYSSDYSEISEEYKVGDIIKVLCHTVKDDGKVEWGVRTLRKREKPIEHPFQEGDVVVGRVQGIRDVKTFTSAFIRIAAGIDVMVRVADDLTIRHGSSVAVQIQAIDPPEGDRMVPKMRGILVRVVGY